MRVSCIALFMIGLILTGGWLPAAGQPIAVAPAAGPPPWAVVVRARVANALSSIRRTAARGRISVAFTVTEAGDIVDVHVEGAPKTAARATAILKVLGKVPPPPDQRSHAVQGGVNFR